MKAVGDGFRALARRFNRDERAQADMTGTLILTALMIIVGVGLVYKFWEQLRGVFDDALKYLGSIFTNEQGQEYKAPGT